jgi:hypothetical protein
MPEAEQFYRGRGTEAMNKNQDDSPSTERQRPCEVYSNQFSLGWTARDLRIQFRQLIVTAGDPVVAAERPGGWSNEVTKLLAEERAAVTTSWSDAKVLAGMLTEAVQRFEAANGEIKQPVCPGAEPGPQSSRQDFTN